MAADFFFFSSRRRHTRFDCDWSSDVCSSDLAQRFYREQSQKAFVLDTSLPRSPWWLLPSLGDAVVTFETARRGTLTFGVAGSDPEDLTLFDRRKRLQICMYPSGGRSTRYSED